MHPLLARLAVVIGAVLLLSGSLGASAKVEAISAIRQLRTSGEPFAIAVDPSIARAYVSDTRENALFVFDLATGEVVATVPTGRQPGPVVLLSGRVYVSNFADATITVVDTATNRAVKTIQAGGLGLAADATSKRLYAAAGTRIAVLDTATDGLLATIPAPPGANLWGLALDASSRRLFVTDIAAPRVFAYDLDSYARVAEIAIDAPARFGIATGAGGRVFVASYTDRSPQLSLIDGASATVSGRLAIANFTMSLAVQPTSGVVYASSGRDRSITAIDPATRLAVGTTRVAQASGGVAAHPSSGEIFVATAGGAPPPRAIADIVPVVKP
jgi:YVTN family beta-propeller protein